MQYLDPADAQALPGLRLALTVGFPAPYSLLARTILDLRRVQYVAVAQYGAQSNAERVAWTRHRNAPVAGYARLDSPRASATADDALIR